MKKKKKKKSLPTSDSLGYFSLTFFFSSFGQGGQVGGIG
jgi:hypothetical protein